MKRGLFILLFITIILFISGLQSCNPTISVGSNPYSCCNLLLPSDPLPPPNGGDCINDIPSDKCDNLYSLYNPRYGSMIYQTNLPRSCLDSDHYVSFQCDLSCNYKNSIYRNREKVCLEDAKKIYRCTDGRWTEFTDCSSQNGCVNTQQCQNPSLTPDTNGYCSTGVCGQETCTPTCLYDNDCINTGKDIGCFKDSLCDRNTNGNSCNTGKGTCSEGICCPMPNAVLFMHFEPSLYKYNDEFTGTNIDATKWSVTPGLFSITQNDKLIFSKTVTTTSGGLVTTPTKILEGDFSVEIDYNLVNFPYPSSGVNQLQLEVSDGSTLTLWIVSAQREVGNKSAFSTWRTDTGSNWISPGYVVIDPQSTGRKIKLTRKGAIIYAHYYDSAGNWVSVGQTSIPTSPLKANIRVQNNGASTPLNVEVDNFIVGIVNDSSSNHYGITRGSTYTASSLSGKAMNFNGISDYIEIPAYSNLDLSNHQFTIEFGFKLDTLPAANIQNVFVSRIDNSPSGWTKGYQVLYSADTNGNIYISGMFRTNTPTNCANGNKDQGQNINYNLNTNQWYHLVYVYSDSAGIAKTRLYLDGNLLGEKNTYGTNCIMNPPTNYTSYSYKAYIGTNIDGAPAGSTNRREVDGTMDEVLIYNKSLTDKEIKSHYDYYTKTGTPMCV